MTVEHARSRWTPDQLIGTVVRSVWQWQLVLAFSGVVTAIAVAVLQPAMFASAQFTIGLSLLVALTAATLMISWARYPRWAILAVPLIDVIAVGVLADAQPSFGYLWVFPVAWVATYYNTRAVVVTLSVVALTQLVGRFQSGYSATTALDTIIVLFALGFLAVMIQIGTRRMRAYRHLLRRQSVQLDRALLRGKANESRTGALVDSLSVALARVARDQRIVATNASYRELYSYVEGDYRHPARAVEYSDYRGTALAPDQTSIARAARGERVEHERLWIYDASGAWRALSLSIRDRDRDAEGSVGSIIVLEDETALVEAERAQRSSTSAISHELRNPLTAILGHADLLLDSPTLSPTDRERAIAVDAAAERMLTLVSRLLDNRRDTDDTGRPFDLGDIVRAAVAAFAAAATLADLSVTSSIEPGLQLTGDAFRLRQVVDNLISNAIKYTPRGGTVTVVARQEGGDIDIIVTDSGIGISAADLEHVFDPYFRARSVTGGATVGTGLGMGIARDIVRQHGGDITIASQLGHGTTARVRLPATPATPAPARPAPPVTPPSPNGMPHDQR